MVSKKTPLQEEEKAGERRKKSQGCQAPVLGFTVFIFLPITPSTFLLPAQLLRWHLSIPFHQLPAPFPMGKRLCQV